MDGTPPPPSSTPPDKRAQRQSSSARPTITMSPAPPPLLRRHLTKMFSSYDSLKFELARLETFIDWPVPWLNPADLAANGFYFMRKDDHCACVFCRGIVGEWEEGDTPSGEHCRHMSECPFINGRAVGNVPMNQCDILDKLPLSGENYPCAQPRCLIGDDDDNDDSDDDLVHLGLYRFKWALRNEYITNEQRMKSFGSWPIRSPNQTPKQMAEAGFYYTNLSDHVKCFHCGGGVHNWRHDDQPWDEHARWYPHCVFVVLMKGQTFIDRVKPNVAPSSGQFNPLSDSDLDEMMESDVVLAVIDLGFPSLLVRNVLWQRVKDTGLPFFSTITCVDKLLENMSDDEQKKLVEVNVEEEFEITEFEQLRVIDYEKELPPPEPAAAAAAAVVEVDDEPFTCKICLKNKFEIAFLPCHHVSTCSNCTSMIKYCPMCRSDISYFHHALL